MTSAGAHIAVRELVVQRGGVTVLEVDSLDVPRGQVTALIGPNGAGKSTLLAVLQLVLHPSQGTLTFDGEPMHADPVRTRRRMAAAFQEALLLSMTVRANVELPLRLRGVGRRQRREQAKHWLDRFGILALATRHARQLSGGEAQRVSLARAFASQPEVLLLDEPFAGVDAPTREGLIADFAEILSQTRPTTVLVTHDRDEALRLADQVALLIDGQVRQIGTPLDVFDRPVDREVAAFVGMENILPGTALPPEIVPSTASDSAWLCIRAEHIGLEPLDSEQVDSDQSRKARILHADLIGAMIQVRLDLSGVELVAKLPRVTWSQLNVAVGDEVNITIAPGAVHQLPH